MTNHDWQTVSAAVVLVGLVLAALGGYGVHVFRQRAEREREARSAYSGQLKAPAAQVLLSGPNNVWPHLEFGDSGASFIYTGPSGTPLFSFGADAALTIVREAGQIKLSTIIRDHTGRIIAELVSNEWKVNPQNSWDRNYTADALEVKDPTGDIVLQVRVLPDRVQLQAKLHDVTGRGFGFGKLLGPDGKWGGGLFLGDALPRLHISPMFKYPSDQHLGDLVAR